MKVLAQVSASEHRILTVLLLINNVCYSMLSAVNSIGCGAQKNLCYYYNQFPFYQLTHCKSITIVHIPF